MTFQLKTEYIELFKLIKIMNLAESGGQAKLFIDEGEVLLNGQLEKRKRAKIKVGDIVEIFDQKIEIVA